MGTTDHILFAASAGFMNRLMTSEEAHPDPLPATPPILAGPSPR